MSHMVHLYSPHIRLLKVDSVNFTTDCIGGTLITITLELVIHTKMSAISDTGVSKF